MTFLPICWCVCRCCRRSIETEKNVYKDSFEQLRVLKPKIEHIKKVIEKCRVTLLSQYDQWYAFLNLRIDDLSLASLAAGADADPVSSSSYAESTSEMVGSSSTRRVSTSVATQPYSAQEMYEMSRASDSTSLTSPQYNRTTPPYTQRDGPPTSRTGGKDTGTPRKPSPHQQSLNTTPTIPTTSYSISSTPRPAYRGEGKEGGGSVEDDISAFYRAKEEILKMQGQSQAQQSPVHK